MSEWGAVEVADLAELIASELVTNAVNACAGLDQAAIRLVLTLNQGELAVLVRDNHPGAPVAIQAGAQDEGGRGLLIVEHLSERCGWYRLDERKPAKVTWAVITGPGGTAATCPKNETRTAFWVSAWPRRHGLPRSCQPGDGRPSLRPLG